LTAKSAFAASGGGGRACEYIATRVLLRQRNRRLTHH
jgi:hypothetical protein